MIRNYTEKFWYERYKYHLQMINKRISKSKKSYFRKFEEYEDIFINSDGKSMKKYQMNLIIII